MFVKNAEDSCRTIETCDSKTSEIMGQEDMESELESLREMIKLLLMYEEECIEDLDLSGAKQTRNRIKFFLQKEEKLVQELVNIKQTKKIMNITQKNQSVLSEFDREWSEYLGKVVEEFALIQKKLKNKQASERQELMQKSQVQKNNFKGSTELISLKRKIIGLMKLHHYQEAQNESKCGLKLEMEERKIWEEKAQKRKTWAVELLEKKHSREFQILRSKNQDFLHKKLKERDNKFQNLLKNRSIRQQQISKTKKEFNKTLNSTAFNTMRIFK